MHAQSGTLLLMFRVLKQSWALMLGVLLLMLGNGLQGTLLGVRGSLEHIDSGSMGFIMAGYFVGFLGGSKLTPILLQRVGHVRVFAALGSLVSAAFILYASIIDPVCLVGTACTGGLLLLRHLRGCGKLARITPPPTSHAARRCRST